MNLHYPSCFLLNSCNYKVLRHLGVFLAFCATIHWHLLTWQIWSSCEVGLKAVKHKALILRNTCESIFPWNLRSIQYTSGTREQVLLRVWGDPWECLHMKQFQVRLQITILLTVSQYQYVDHMVDMVQVGMCFVRGMGFGKEYGVFTDNCLVVSVSHK